MLAYNDKWWRYKYDDKNLKRFGHRKREEVSCIPVELRNGEYRYSCERESQYAYLLLVLIANVPHRMSVL